MRFRAVGYLGAEGPWGDIAVHLFVFNSTHNDDDSVIWFGLGPDGLTLVCHSTRERGHVLHFGSQPEVLALVSHVIASEALAAGHAVLRTWTPTALESVCVQNRMSGLSRPVLVEAVFKDTR